MLENMKMSYPIKYILYTPVLQCFFFPVTVVDKPSVVKLQHTHQCMAQTLPRCLQGEPSFKTDFLLLLADKLI